MWPFDDAQSGPATSLMEGLRGRWKALMDWGVKEKVPSAHLQWEAWEAFVQRWDAGDPDTPNEINAYISELNEVEGVAKGKGFQAPAPMVGVDVEKITDKNQVATAISDTAKAIQEDLPVPKIPWGTVGLVGAGLVVLVGLVAGWASRQAIPYPMRMRRDGAP